LRIPWGRGRGGEGGGGRGRKGREGGEGAGGGGALGEGRMSQRTCVRAACRTRACTRRLTCPLLPNVNFRCHCAHRRHRTHGRRLLARTHAGGLCLQNGIPCPVCCHMNHMVYTRCCLYRLLSPIPCGYIYRRAPSLNRRNPGSCIPLLCPTRPPEASFFGERALGAGAGAGS
jgi:hypothetical protein